MDTGNLASLSPAYVGSWRESLCARSDLAQPTLADSVAEGNAKNLLRMIALKERLPELNIVPAHDMRAFADMPSSIRPGSKYLQILARSNRSLERENRANFRAKILPFAHGPSFEQWEITG